MLRSLLLFFALAVTPVSAATVISIGDGDTLRVLEAGKRVTIRLACIDAPETSQVPYGMASRQKLQQLAPIGTELTLRVQATDRYGRTVAELYKSGQSINLEMVRSGHAFAYRQYLRQCNETAYLGAEAIAQQQRLGVWSVPGGIQRPWEWRHGGRASHSSSSSSASVAPGNAVTQPLGHHYTCKEIGNFAMAQQLLKQGHTYLDRDGDGVI